MNSTLLLTAFSGSQPGPTLLGVDVVWASTMLVAVGIFAVIVAIYGALTVRDPMAKRVKALNDRRADLAGDGVVDDFDEIDRALLVHACIP